MGIKEYTMAIFVRNQMGILNQVTKVFVDNTINITSLGVSESRIQKYSLMHVIANGTKIFFEGMVKDLNELEGVVKSCVISENEVIYQELVLIKMDTDKVIEDQEVKTLVERQSLQIVEIKRDFVIFSKVGNKREINEILQTLSSKGIIQFSKSGRALIFSDNKCFKRDY